MIVLIASIEESDHPARDKDHLVGVFLNERRVADAKAIVKARIIDRRIWWREISIEPNKIIMPEVR